MFLFPSLPVGQRGRACDGAPARLLDPRAGRWMRLDALQDARFEAHKRQILASGTDVLLWIAPMAGVLLLAEFVPGGESTTGRQLAILLGVTASELLARRLRARRLRAFLLEHGRLVEGPVAMEPAVPGASPRKKGVGRLVPAAGLVALFALALGWSIARDGWLANWPMLALLAFVLFVLSRPRRWSTRSRLSGGAPC